jgi:hypothetical protein
METLGVFPMCSLFNPPDNRGADLIFRGDCASWPRVRTYGPSLFTSQLCQRVRLGMDTWPFVSPSFRSHISKIFGLGSDPQMIRANARSIVAFVANYQSFRNDLAVCSLIGKAMCRVSLEPHRETTVSVPPDRACPFPTTVRLFHIGVEIFRRMLKFFTGVSSIADKATNGAGFFPPCPGVERFPTNPAGYRYERVAFGYHADFYSIKALCTQCRVDSLCGWRP